MFYSFFDFIWLVPYLVNKTGYVHAYESIKMVHIMDINSHLISAGESALPSLVALEYGKRQTGIAHSRYHWMTVLGCQIHMINWCCVGIRSQKQHDIFSKWKNNSEYDQLIPRRVERRKERERVLNARIPVNFIHSSKIPLSICYLGS